MLFKKRGKKRTERVKNRDSNPKLVLIRQIVMGVILAILVALLGTGIWYGSRVEMLTITSIDVIGGETIPHEVLKAIAEEELSGEYYKLVPRRFAWTYPKETIEKRISSIDRLKQVRVERTSGTNITIIFEEYVPFALWCENVDDTECLFLDRDGYAFSKAPKLAGGAFVRFSEDGRTPQQFEYGFDAQYIRETEKFIERAYDSLGLNIIHVEKMNDNEVSYYVAGGGLIKVSLRMTTEDTLDNLTTILTSDEFSHIAPGNFQYIDLRYGNKIFVNEEPIAAAVDTSTASSTE